MSEPWARFVGNAEGGKFRPFDKDRLQKAIKALEGKRVELAIREEPKSRSLPQNAYLHVLCKILAEETGETLLRMKRLAVLSALGLEDGTTKETLLGKEFLEVRPTSDLTKGEAAKVLDWLLSQCSFCGVPVPKPEHVEVIA